MQPLLDLLKRCVENHTFDSGDSDCKTVLDKLLSTLPLDDNNAVWNSCCRICTAYEHKAFIDGFHYGFQLMKELK